MAKKTVEELDDYLKSRVLGLMHGKSELEAEVTELENKTAQAGAFQKGQNLDRKALLESQIAGINHEMECLADLRELALPGTSTASMAGIGHD